MVSSVVKYSVQKSDIQLNRNYPYTMSLYNILHGGNTVETFVGSILTALPRKAKIYNMVTKSHSTGSVLDPKLMLESEEVWFTSNGYVNSQNNR
jgi:hypothetical protein